MKAARMIVAGCVAVGLLALAGAARAQSAWQTLPEAMPTPRAEAAAAVLDGLIYVVGGEDGRGRVLDEVEALDPWTGTWEVGLPRLRRARRNAAAVVLDGRLYVIGGRVQGGEGEGRRVLDEVEVYDPAEGRWRAAAGLPRGREGHAAVVLDGRIYVVGGSDEDGEVLRSVVVYDAGRDAWDEAGDWRLDVGRVAHAVVALGDSVLSFGGIAPLAGLVQPVQVFRRGGAGVTIQPPADFEARSHFAALVLGDMVYLVGGRGRERQQRPNILDDVTVFEPAYGAWRREAPLHTARERFAAAAVDGRLFVFGGRDAFGDVLGSVEMFETGLSTGIVDEEAPAAPGAVRLDPAFPNPFHGETTIPFVVEGPAGGRVVVEVFDLSGRRVATVVDAVLAPGPHRVGWDGTATGGRPLASGTYVCRLRQGAHVAVRLLSILR